MWREEKAMTALEEIKKALEGDMNTGLTAIDRLRFIVGGVPDFDPITVEDADWLISALESLQRENEELRQRLDVGPYGEDAIDVAESAADHLRQRAEAAEAEVKRLITVVQTAHVAMTLAFHMPGVAEEYDFSDAIAATFQALASTGGEHHAE
ncbi:MAG: hypothetical protein JSR13_05795 [Proteobacteria bacterium]|nr:hypothetical protein [Pseudomonadota bacterium]